MFACLLLVHYTQNYIFILLTAVETQHTAYIHEAEAAAKTRKLLAAVAASAAAASAVAAAAAAVAAAAGGAGERQQRECLESM